MYQYRVLLNTIAFFAFASFSQSAQAKTGTIQKKQSSIPQSSKMHPGGAVSAPLGHAVFCRKHPGQCRYRSGARKTSNGGVLLTGRAWSDLVRVNRQVNRSIISRTDQRNHGKLDVWSIQGRYGDCEDYALRKRQKLLRLGWPSRALLITTAWDHKRRPHAVLMVKTSKGDFILDNLTSRIKPWRRVPYRWIKQQSRQNPKRWVKLSSYRHHKTSRLKQTRFKNKREAKAYLKTVLRKLERNKKRRMKLAHRR